MNQGVQHVVIRANLDLRYIGSADRIRPNQAKKFCHSRMRQRSRGKRFDRDTRVLQCPGFPESFGYDRRIVGAAVSMEESAFRFQNLFSAGPAERSEVSGKNSALGRMTRLKGLHHCAEILPESGCLAGCNCESSSRVNRIESFEPGAGGSTTENAARTGGVEPVLIMSGRNGF